MSVHLEVCKVLVQGLKDLGLMKGNVEEAVAAGAHALFLPHGLGHMSGLLQFMSQVSSFSVLPCFSICSYMSLGIDEHRVVFDYLHHATLNGKPLRDCTYDQELIAHGSRVYTVSFASAGLGQFIKEVEEFFVKHGREYDIVHCHMPNSAFCVLREAKRAGIEHRVLHSHLNSSSDNVLHRVRNAPLIAWGKRYATDGVACSDEAGRYLFGNKPFAVMKNGIVLSNYAYDDSSNASLRAELCIGNSDPVIGSVGRFCLSKRTLNFGVKVFAELKRSIPNVKWVILGAGDGMDRVRAIAKELGVTNPSSCPACALTSLVFTRCSTSSLCLRYMRGFLSLLLKLKPLGFVVFFRLAFLRKVT